MTTPKRIRQKDYMDFIRAARATKRALANQIMAMFDSTVQAGPLQGLKLSPDTTWGHDVAAQLFGHYEQQLMPYLTGHTRAVFVDLGAADGFWAVGLVQAGHFDKAICFEMRPAGRDCIAKNAAANGVTDKIIIHGEAGDDIAEVIATDVPPSVPLVVLIDIEGAEFTLLTDTFLEKIKHATLIVELHPWATADGAGAVTSLARRAGRYFDLTYLRDTHRDMTALLDRLSLHDHLRYLLMSEERGQPQQWLVMTHKQ